MNPFYLDDGSFAAASYEKNCLATLLVIRGNGPDLTDMYEWRLTSDEWFDAIDRAIDAHKYDHEHGFEVV